MSTATTPRRTAWAVAAALTAVAAVAACTRGGEVVPAAPPATSAAATPATSTESTAAATVTSSTTTTTTTTTAAPASTDGTITRAPSEVSSALLDTSSFVAGIRVVPTPTGSSSPGAGGPGDATVTSDNPKCAAFTTDSGARGPAGAPGVTGHASIAFQDDPDPAPFLFESITTVGTSGHAAELLAALEASNHGCSKVTMTVPGIGASTMTVTPVTPPAHGDHATAVRLVGASGPLRGLHITVIATGVVDGVLTLMFIQAAESDIDGVTADAVARATAVFTHANAT